MENYRRNGYEGRENRRDYGNERHQEKSYTGEYSQAGRKLRHRKNGVSGTAEGGSSYSERRRTSFSGERSSYRSSDRRNSGYSERRSYGSGKSYGEGGRNYGQNRSYGEGGKSFGGRKPSGRNFGEGEGRTSSYGNDQRRSFVEGRPSSRRSFNDGGRRSFDNRGRKFGTPAGKPGTRMTTVFLTMI